jgi:Mg2+/Co2+ transporter CorC
VQGGQTIADLAKANGKTAQDVIDALVAEVEQHFADEVASGEHTQADADARIADATTRITDFVNNTQAHMLDEHGPGHGMMDDDSMGGGMMGGTIDGGPSDTATTAP